VGPFFLIEHTPFTEPGTGAGRSRLTSRAALAQWDDMQIELVQQHDQRPCLNNESQALLAAVCSISAS
jgi:hypothetical protein